MHAQNLHAPSATLASLFEQPPSDDFFSRSNAQTGPRSKGGSAVSPFNSSSSSDFNFGSVSSSFGNSTGSAQNPGDSPFTNLSGFSLGKSSGKANKGKGKSPGRGNQARGRRSTGSPTKTPTPLPTPPTSPISPTGSATDYAVLDDAAVDTAVMDSVRALADMKLQGRGFGPTGSSMFNEALPTVPSPQGSADLPAGTADVDADTTVQTLTCVMLPVCAPISLCIAG